ncbi:MAG: AI-2E family transporter [Reyranella sp.]|nr:AI-2E family transporter [Reyranella sp.]
MAAAAAMTAKGPAAVIAQTAGSGRWLFWLGAAAVFLLVLWLLNDILLPFVVGVVVAYFLDPVVGRLQRAGLSRTWATTAVTIAAALAFVGAVMAVLPSLFGQLQELIAKAPQYVVQAATRLQPLVEPLRERFGMTPLSLQEIQGYATQWAGQALSVAGSVAGAVAQRGVAVINLLGLLFLTPVVTFYLLRDWEKVVGAIDAYLPLEHAGTIRKLAGQSNAAIAGYLRGQALVCLCLATIYGLGLSLVGLQFGLIIGLIAGAISFIPFVGTLVGATLAIGMALAQFPPDWMGVAKVAAVFVVGQALEGNVLSPKLVGDRVGLHPVWIMFALLAGGTLFGFVGVLVAVPTAAVAGVIVRHLLERYRESSIYRGTGTG